MEREENIYTSTGINTPAAMTLWKLVRDDVKLRNRVIAVINTYRNYYKCLSDIKNVKVRVHMMRVLLHSSEKEVFDSQDKKVETYFHNVLTYIYRKAIKETKPDQILVRKLKKIKSSNTHTIRNFK
jgi:hypothetical protein